MDFTYHPAQGVRFADERAASNQTYSYGAPLRFREASRGRGRPSNVSSSSERASSRIRARPTRRRTCMFPMHYHLILWIFLSALWYYFAYYRGTELAVLYLPRLYLESLVSDARDMAQRALRDLSSLECHVQ